MMLRERYVRRGDPDGVEKLDRSLPFAAIDPGAEGGVVVCGEDGGPTRLVSVISLHGPGTYPTIAWSCWSAGVRTLIVEDQHRPPPRKRKKGPPMPDTRGLARLARSCGQLVGAIYCVHASRTRDRTLLQGIFEPAPMEVVYVGAETWARLALGLRGRPKRAERKELALRLAGVDLAGFPSYGAANKASRSGMADAYGIARWWLQLPPPEGLHHAPTARPARSRPGAARRRAAGTR